MALKLTIVILATFLLPLITMAMIVYWRKQVIKRVEKEEKEKEQLIGVMEEIIDTKNSIIDKLKT